MKKDELFDAVTQIDDRHIAHADGHVFPRAARWKPYLAMAAAVVLVVGLGPSLLQMALGGMGGSSGASTGAATSGAASSAGGSDPGQGLHSAPILPWTLPDGADGLTVSREITYDFGGLDEETGTHAAVAAVADRYTLANGTDADVTRTVAYPYAGAEALPALAVDGAPVEPGLSNRAPGEGYDKYEQLGSEDVVWLTCEVTVPAGGAVTVEAAFDDRAACDPSDAVSCDEYRYTFMTIDPAVGPCETVLRLVNTEFCAPVNNELTLPNGERIALNFSEGDVVYDLAPATGIPSFTLREK